MIPPSIMAAIPKIAIIGAGPAGLTLARLLHMSKAQIDLTLYERDASPTARPDQGGTLDLHADTGLAAIRKCGLWDSFQKYARYDGEEKTIADKNATVLVHMKGGGGRPEIDRERLKEILLESVPEANVRWGHVLKEATAEGMLSFDQKEKMDGPFDLIVGAEGAWSKVRAKVTDVKPVYAGVSGYEMEIKEPAKTCPHVDKMVGAGSFGSHSDRKFLNGQRLGTGAIKVRSWFVCSESEAKERLDKGGKETIIDRILSRYPGWAPELTELFKQADPDSLRHWILYELPVGSKWEHKKRFTLIGDAASLATPFSGEGVNKAMEDSLQLAELIERSQDPEHNLTLDQAVLQYEQAMFPRAEKLQAKTMMNKQAAFTSDSPVQLMTIMLKYMTGQSPSIWIRMLGTAPVVAIAYGLVWVRLQIGWAVRWYWRGA